MTIEIADRLIKLRKKNGYSQEELADKLGLSRQAVSKWERAEASPDTDNLICLAKLYGISLDELLSTDDDVETIVKEQVRQEEPVDKEEGIHLVDDEGNEVSITEKGVNLATPNGEKRKVKVFKDKFDAVIACVECGLFLLSVVAYILLGTYLNMWHNAWVLMFTPGIMCSFVRAIKSKNANKVNMVFIALFVFFFVCMVKPGMSSNLWHPMWVVFLSIPLYHSVVSTIHKVTNKHIDKEDE